MHGKPRMNVLIVQKKKKAQNKKPTKTQTPPKKSWHWCCAYMLLWRNKKGELRVYEWEKVVHSVYITMNILTEGTGIKSDAKNKQASL